MNMHSVGDHLGRLIGPKFFEEGSNMNWDQVEGKWKQYSGKAKEKWGKLTNDDWQQISGKRDQLLGKIQERYGISREQAEKQLDDFTKSLGERARAV
jgi:uncharacterized protein YjbJ (UPF0337 family)